MPRRKVIPINSDIITLPILEEQLSLKVLLHRVKKESNPRKERSLEQKIIALKILVLNNMQWSATAKQVGVDRKTIHNWWVQYGELIKKTEPEKQIVKAIATDVAIARGDSMREWYDLLEDSAKKLRKLVNESTGTRSIYAIVEAVKASAEVIKTDNEVNGKEKDKGNEFYTNIFNTIIENKYGKDGNKG